MIHLYITFDSAKSYRTCKIAGKRQRAYILEKIFGKYVYERVS